MTKSTPTLTQSGLLAVLLQRQRYKAFHLTRRRAQRKRVGAAFWNALTWTWRARRGPTLLDDSAEPIGRTRRRRPFLRVAPPGSAVHFDAKGIQEAYRCYLPRPQTAK
jgi:hypothetical protein